MNHSSSAHRSARIAVAATFAIGSLLTGCGDEESAAAKATTTEAAISTSTATSEADFVAAGNEVCVRIGADVQAAFPDFEGEPTIEEAKQLGADLAPVFEDFRISIAALDPPDDAAEAHQELLAQVDTAVDGLEAMSTDAGAEAAIANGGPPIDDATQAAHALFDQCPA